ncbi:MAG: EamA family transporter [Armatimonadota bacterium]
MVPEFFIIITLAAALANTLQNTTIKFILARGMVGAVPTSLLILSLTGIIALPFIGFSDSKWSATALALLLLMCIIWLVAFVLLTYGFEKEDASVIGPILGVKVIFLALLEPLLSRQAVTPGTWTGVVLCVLGITLISQTDRWSLRPKNLLRPGVLLVGLAAVLFSITDLLSKYILNLLHNDSWSLTLYMSVLLGLLSVVILLAMVRYTFPGWVCAFDCTWTWPLPRAFNGLLGICVVMGLIAQYSLLTAFAVSPSITLANILYNTRVLFVVLLMAFLVLFEHSKVERVGWRAYLYRVLGAILILGAVVTALLFK